MFTKTEDPYLRVVLAFAAKMRQQTAEHANTLPVPARRFYFDALVATLDKIMGHFPHFFPSLSNNEKYSIIDSLQVNDDIIHLDHARRVTTLTRLKEKEALTVEAVTNFYTQKDRLHRSTANRHSMVLQGGVLHRICHDDPNHPGYDVVSEVDKTTFYTEQKTNTHRAKHAVILYNDALYHYDNTAPEYPTLTLIVPAPFDDETEEAKAFRNAYAQLKKKIDSRAKNEIFKAEAPTRIGPHTPAHSEREWMEILLTAAVITKEKNWRAINLDLIQEFLQKFPPFLKVALKKWQEVKKTFLSLVLKVALWILGLSLLWFLLAGVLILPELAALVKLVIMPSLAILMLGLGAFLYCFTREKLYQTMLNDFTKIEFSHAYDAANPPYFIRQSTSAFFQEHNETLAAPFTPPVSLL